MCIYIYISVFSLLAWYSETALPLYQGRSEPPDLGFQILLLIDRNLGFMEKKLILWLGQEKYTVSLAHLITPQTRKCSKNDREDIKIRQKSDGRSSHWQI